MGALSWGMRKLRLTLGRSSTGLPILLAAACSAGESNRTATPGYVRDAGQEGTQLVFPTDVTYVPEPDAGSPDAGSPDAESPDVACQRLWGELRTVTVPIPSEGTPATLADVCASASSPVLSASAARVTLAYDPASGGHRARGRIDVAADLRGAVIGLPFVTTLSGTISAIRRDGDGYAFDVYVDWRYTPPDTWSIGFATVLEIACGDAADSIRLVQATTNLQLCLDGPDRVWRSSGEPCTSCYVSVCEMAPSPILPPRAGDGLPLARAIDLRLKCIGRVGPDLLLLAEHDAGDVETSYEWSASAGTLTMLDRDVAVWTLPDAGTHVAQVGVLAGDGAAMATFQLAA
jgi:hypothetical protein